MKEILKMRGNWQKKKDITDHINRVKIGSSKIKTKLEKPMNSTKQKYKQKMWMKRWQSIKTFKEIKCNKIILSTTICQ